MDLSLNEVFGRYWDCFYRHLKDLLVFSICYFLDFICLHLSGFLIFWISVFRFYEAMKAAARCFLSAIIDIPTVREWALGGGVVIYWNLCRFVVDYLQIVWKLWVFCRLFASFLSSVSVLILFNISGLNWFFTIGKECCSSRPWSSYESTLACYPDARKRFY